MTRHSYDLEEQAAISEMVAGRATAAALKKFFTIHCQHHTEQARNCLNAIPQNLHEQAKNQEMAKQYAAMAKAYGTMWAELETAAKG
jgi:pyrroloquinoline quinone (PQQ) biosynthesis protein C